MFNEVGSKLMKIAKIIAGLVLAVYVIIGVAVVFIATAADAFFAGLLIGLVIMALGFVTAWIGSAFLYAFGQLIDDVHTMSENVYSLAYNVRVTTEKALK